MEKIKAFIENYKKWQPLDKHVQRIEAYSDNDPVFIVENSKALIESICKTILKEANEDYDSSVNVNKLVKDALKHLGVLNQNIQIANALVTISQKIGELRNAFGTVSHGQPIDDLEKGSPISQATSDFILNVTDNLACYILHVYHHEHPQRNVPKLGYKDNDEFNVHLDELYEKALVASNEYLPSEILFNLDLTAYKAALTDYEQS